MKEKIKKLRSTEKGKTLFKFILYMIFFVFVLVICIIGGNMESPYVYKENESKEESVGNSEEAKELTYFEKQEILYKGTYEFEYKISGTVNVNYIGEYDNGVIDGFKETEDELVRYVIEDGVIYKTTLVTKEVYDDLYSEVDESLFDFKALFSKLNSTSSRIELEGEKKVYNYENIDGYTYKIVTIQNGIESMNIENETMKYEFNFDYR